MDNIFEKKQIGCPQGSYDEKRQTFCDMLNKGQIKQPQELTFEYYTIFKEGDVYFYTYVFMDNLCLNYSIK